MRLFLLLVRRLVSIACSGNKHITCRILKTNVSRLRLSGGMFINAMLQVENMNKQFYLSRRKDTMPLGRGTCEDNWFVTERKHRNRLLTHIKACKRKFI
ncbi:hypothetical protein Peur_070019 [Populus x canadensis]